MEKVLKDCFLTKLRKRRIIMLSQSFCTKLLEILDKNAFICLNINIFL